jgi:predicted nucleic acid-binding protein
VATGIRIGRPLRAYVDTSVFGGVHDVEFREPTERFFHAVRRGEIIVVVSAATAQEIAVAPETVRAVFEEHADGMELVEHTAEATTLAQAYLAARVVRPTANVDALHVAIASIARVDVLVSWNFKDIVQLRRIRGFHAVNIAHGYPLIEIRSPLEVA